MKRRISIIQKIKAIAALAIVFLLVLATNMMDNHHLKIVQGTLVSIYEDRLVAKDYLYKISKQLQLKEIVLCAYEVDKFSSVYKVANDSIEALITKYAATKLTSKEDEFLQSLQRNLFKLNKLEEQMLIKPLISTELDLVANMETQFLKIKKDLNVLFKIQLEESRRQIGQSNQAIATSNLISRLEIGTLIVIGIIIQLLILYKSKG